MKTTLSHFSMAAFTLLLLLNPGILSGQQDASGDKKSDQKETDKQDNVEKIATDQARLSNQYKDLEETLFKLYEYESDKNASRSDLLKRAFEQSKEKLTARQLEQVVSMLGDEKLNNAIDGQEQVLVELKLMLELLQSEDRGKQVRDRIEQLQEVLKETKRIARIQKGIRGQTEGGVDTERLANSQEKTADRTEDVANKLKENDPAESGSDGQQSNGQQNDGQQNDGQKSDSQSGKQGEKSSDENKSGDQKDDQNKKEGDNEKKDGEQESSDQSESGDSQSGEKSDSSQSSKGSQQSQQSQQSQGGEGDSSDSQPQPQDQQDEVQKKLQAAEKKMRDAQLKLEKAKREQSVEDMKEAEKELEEAIKELEEILRQLREEEIGRMLAMLESRFRQMLERELKVYESTRRLNAIVPEQRGTDFEIRAGELSVNQRSIANDAGKALMLLLEDGTSVAFPETVADMKDDMDQVAARLSSAMVGTITQEIEEDIIDTLDYLIEALVKAQQDLEEQQGGQQGGQGGGAGDAPLVDQIAELKMLRGLQDRIYKRHKRYARLLEDPEDPLGVTDDPDMHRALKRLADRQEKLTRITHDIVVGKNK